MYVRGTIPYLTREFTVGLFPEPEVPVRSDFCVNYCTRSTKRNLLYYHAYYTLRYYNICCPVDNVFRLISVYPGRGGDREMPRVTI